MDQFTKVISKMDSDMAQVQNCDSIIFIGKLKYNKFFTYEGKFKNDERNGMHSILIFHSDL